MAHDVFISHSTRDKFVSDAVCAALENAGIRCWVAPRDVQPGRSFAGEITRAIQHSRVMVLIFSTSANKSAQVLREVQLAVDSQLHILQFRIEEVLLNDDLKYYLSTPHWLDAMTPPLEDHLDHLTRSLLVLLEKAPREPPVYEDQQRKAPGTAAVNRETAGGDRSKSSRKSAIIVGAVFGAVACAIAIALWWFFLREPVPFQSEAKVFAPVAATASAPPSSSSASARKPFQHSWDFSAGMLRDVRSEEVELVDASIWKMAGGKHLRFLTGGRSWLDATFDFAEAMERPTRLTVRHLSSSPDGQQPGYSPVRITLNGHEIFRGSPAESGWMEQQIDLGGFVQPGRNTLRWEYLHGAQTHYWLKSFQIQSAPP